MKRSEKRILTTHVGSLVRPPQIAEMMLGRPFGQPFSPEEAATIRAAVAEAVRRQVACGIDIPSDGEYSKSSFSNYVQDRLTGFERRPARPGMSNYIGRDRKRFADAYATLEGTGGSFVSPAQRGQQGAAAGSAGAAFGAVVCAGPIAYRGQKMVEDDIANFRAALDGLPVEEAFIPAVAPGTIELQRTNEYYRTEEEYLFAIAEAMKTEYRMIVEAGFILQIDDPRVVVQFDMLDPEPSKEEFRKFAALRVEALNHALAGLPEDRIRYHLCWGSWHGPHTTDVPLRDIIDIIFHVRAQAISVEAANPRHAHEYHVWEDVKLPEGRILIPGVIAHTTNCVEHPELIAERIVNYAERVGRENVIAGADCGFAQTSGIQRVHSSIVWEKFRMLAEGARLASERLWGR